MQKNTMVHTPKDLLTHWLLIQPSPWSMFFGTYSTTRKPAYVIP